MFNITEPIVYHKFAYWKFVNNYDMYLDGHVNLLKEWCEEINLT